jgi:Nucleotidyl transferase AbiEii toxin, Type IV TA system
MALKGGTALNLFVLDFPRLTVDIDLNYIGASDRATMLSERPRVEQALEQVFGVHESCPSATTCFYSAALDYLFKSGSKLLITV